MDVIDERLEELLSNVGDMSLKRRARKIIRGLNPKDGDEVIDLGCGDGFYLHLLGSLPLKLKLLGFEYDNIVLKNAKKNLKNKKVKFLWGDIQRMPFNDNSLKKVILTEVLEHIPDDRKALTEIYRVLKPNGIILITVPNWRFPFLWDPINWVLQNIFGIHIGGTGFFAGIWARHLRLYKRDDLVRLIKKTGFKIEEEDELTTRALPFNHYLVNLVARVLYDIKPSSDISDPLSKFKNVRKPWFVRLAFFLVNKYDKLNDIFPEKHGLNIYVKAIK